MMQPPDLGRNDRGLDRDRSGDYNRTDRNNRGTNYDTSLSFGRNDRDSDFGYTLNQDYMQRSNDFRRTSNLGRDDHGDNVSQRYNPVRNSSDFDTLKLGRSSNYSNDYVGSSNLGQSDRNLGRSADLVRNNRSIGYDNTLNMGLSNSISPWESDQAPSTIQNLPLSGVSTQAISLAANLINLLNPQQQNTVPSLLDMPVRARAAPRQEFNRPNRGYGSGRMSNHSQFRSTGTFNRSSGRVEKNKPNRSITGSRPIGGSRSITGSRPIAGSRQPNKNLPQKDNYSKPKPVTKSEQSIKKEDDKKKEEKVPEPKKNDEKSESIKSSDNKKTGISVFDEIKPALLVCHICEKSMWDGRSFENHLRGKAHELKMNKTALDYELTANIMRKQFRLAELKRMQNSGHTVKAKFFCKMCDYAFQSKSHRAGIYHQKLKAYLHPTCNVCNALMKTKIQFDEHKLSLDHLRMLQNTETPIVEAEPMQLSNLEAEKSYICVETQKKQERVAKNRALKNAAKNGGKQEEKPADEIDELIVDYDEEDDFTDCTYDMIPLYNTNRSVGKSFITEFHCYHCKLCNKLLDTEETAETHLKTWKHYRIYSSFISGKISQAKNKDKDSPKTGEKRPLTTEKGESKKPKISDNSENNEKIEGEDGNEVEANDEDEENELKNDDVTEIRDVNDDVIEVADDDEVEEIGEEGDDTAPIDETIPVEDDMDATVDETPADEDLEDWEQWSDPKDGEVEPEQEKPKPAEVKKEKPSPAVKQNKPFPRGRGRGRRRN